MEHCCRCQSLAARLCYDCDHIPTCNWLTQTITMQVLSCSQFADRPVSGDRMAKCRRSDGQLVWKRQARLGDGRLERQHQRGQYCGHLGSITSPDVGLGLVLCSTRPPPLCNKCCGLPLLDRSSLCSARGGQSSSHQKENCGTSLLSPEHLAVGCEQWHAVAPPKVLFAACFAQQLYPPIWYSAPARTTGCEALRFLQCICLRHGCTLREFTITTTG